MSESLIRASAIASLLVSATACAPDDKDVLTSAGAASSIVTLSGDIALHTVDARFSSFAVDTAQVVGTTYWSPPDVHDSTISIEPFDFDRSALRPLVSALAPALLRIGGSGADKIWFAPEGSLAETPSGYDGTLDTATWNALASFAEDTDVDIVFTLNGGSLARNADVEWQGDNAEAFMAFVAERGDPVAAWALGDEVSTYPVTHGISVSPAQLSRDLAAVADLRDTYTPTAQLLGPSVEYWPDHGEPVPYLAEALHQAASIDIVSWHYSPQQSDRCPSPARPAELDTLLDEAVLDEVNLWAEEVETHASQHAPDAPVWMAETSHARCGGAPGVSDTWASTFWYLDQLGILARRGQSVMIRQTLSGGDFGMLDTATLQPRPDYWGALLWRRLMGSRVLEATSELPELRVYAHCHPAGEGAVTVLAINLSDRRSIQAGMAGLSTRGMEVHVLEADETDSTEVRHNGVPLLFGDDLVVPETPGEVLTQLYLPPRSIGFAELPEADADACE